MAAIATRRKLTITEFDRAGAAGVYGPDEKLELIDGEVFCKVSPQESEHSAGIRAVETALNGIIQNGFDVRVQMPVELGSYNKPEPDIAVVAGSWRDYVSSQPSTALLVVEVSDSSLSADRSRKLDIYAGAGIQEYWIINLNESLVEVYRDPAEEGIKSGPGYKSIFRLTSGDTLSPLFQPSSILEVRDLLPW